MKKNKVSITGRILAAFALTVFLFACAGSILTDRLAEKSQTEQTASYSAEGMQKVSDVLAFVTVAMLVIPAIHSVRITTSMGLFKSLVAQRDENGKVTYMTYLQNYLREYLVNFGNDQTKEAITAGRIFFDPITYYIRYVITGLSGKVKILSETTQKSVGVTNFNLGYLPKFTNFAWNKLGVSYCDDATSGSVTAANLAGLTNVRASVDKSVANGEIIISSAKNVIFENPIAPFLIGALSTAGTIGEVDGETDQPRVLRENELVEIEVNLAATVPSTSAHTFGIEVRLTGVQARLRG